MPQADHYLLVEGVNVLDNIYDTDQLSIIRGSSALYKSTITSIEYQFLPSSNNPDGNLKAISTGASSGLFLVEKGTADALVKSIKRLLNEGNGEFENAHYLTFQVVSCQAQNLKEARNKLYTKLRIAQLQDFTQKPDRYGLNDDQLGDKVCGLEGSRIVSAGRKSKVQGDVFRDLSASIFARLESGRGQRQKFYQEALEGKPMLTSLNEKLQADKLENRCRFADNFIELCQDTRSQYPNLSNKMAVVYIDGNQFGARQSEYIGYRKAKGDLDIEAQQSFDNEIQDKRAAFLADEIEGHLGQLDNGGVIPLETLMWGGDEMLLVMPAWQGFDFLQRFFAADWQLGESEQLKPLTHAAGIVFCQANTPIRIIQGLAYDMSEKVKNAKGGREKDGWDYLVLESVDYPTNSDLAHYFQARYGKSLASVRAYASLTAIRDWPVVSEELKEIKTLSKLSKRQLYHVVNTLKESNSSGNDSWLDVTTTQTDESIQYSPQVLAEQRLYAMSEDKQWLRESLPDVARRVFSVNDMDKPLQRAWLWMHILELWDYFAPESVETAVEQEFA